MVLKIYGKNQETQISCTLPCTAAATGLTNDLLLLHPLGDINQTLMAVVVGSCTATMKEHVHTKVGIKRYCTFRLRSILLDPEGCTPGTGYSHFCLKHARISCRFILNTGWCCRVAFAPVNRSALSLTQIAGIKEGNSSLTVMDWSQLLFDCSSMLLAGWIDPCCRLFSTVRSCLHSWNIFRNCHHHYVLRSTVD